MTDYALIEGEVRSHDPRFGAEIVAAWRDAFEYAARTVRSIDGATAALTFRQHAAYHPFRLDSTAEVVQFAISRSRIVGLEPSLVVADGGLDANWTVRHGVPTVTFGVGQRNVHTREEYLEVADFLAACRLAVALAAA